VQGLGLNVQGSELKAQGLGFTVEGGNSTTTGGGCTGARIFPPGHTVLQSADCMGAVGRGGVVVSWCRPGSGT
jgi:hypothetical protein